MLKSASTSRGPSLSKAWEVSKAHKGAYRQESLMIFRASSHPVDELLVSAACDRVEFESIAHCVTSRAPAVVSLSALCACVME